MADAHGSGPCVRKDVGVQLPPCPPARRAGPSGPARRRQGSDPDEKGHRDRGPVVPSGGDRPCVGGGSAVVHLSLGLPCLTIGGQHVTWPGRGTAVVLSALAAGGVLVACGNSSDAS